MADNGKELFRPDALSGSFRKTGAGEKAGEPGPHVASLPGEAEAPASKAGGADAAVNSGVPADAGERPPAASPPLPVQKVRKPSAAPGLAAALIIGALSGFGGAFALRYVDALRGPDQDERVAEANARAAAVESKNEESAAALKTLESRIAAVESTAGQAAASTEAALADLRNAVTERPSSGDGGQPAAASPAPDLGPIREKIAAFERKLGSLDSVQKKLGEIETSLAAPKTDRLAETNAKALAAAHSEGVVAASLLQLVSRGAPFSNEVASLENLGVDPAKLAPLRATAASGVASVADLSDQFAALASSLEDAEAPTPETGVLDRLMRDASNLVRIRRAGDPRDADIPGRIAAIKAALARQDVAKAYDAWSQLPDAARAKAASWAAAAKARLDALAAANAIEADAVTALGKTKS